MGMVGTALGCTLRVKDGVVPNEHGTWLYGRGGWCDGLQVNPWRIDISRQVRPSIPDFYFDVYPTYTEVMMSPTLHL